MSTPERPSENSRRKFIWRTAILAMTPWVSWSNVESHTQTKSQRNSGNNASQTLKILNYNVFYAFKWDRGLTSQYVDWVKNIDPDIIAYQEMTHYTQGDLEILAERYGHSYAIISKERGHAVAITSKYPIVNTHVVNEDVWHGYIYANIEGIHVFVTHLSPFELQSRKKDLKRILAHTKLLFGNEKTLILGDFNALSITDSMMYSDTLEKSMQRIEGRLEPASGLSIVDGKTIYRANLNNGQIDYSVLQMLADEGYVDAFYTLHKSFKHSVPTSGHSKKSSTLRRIDYIMASPDFADRILFADIIQDEITDVLSDHYPVLVVFEN